MNQDRMQFKAVIKTKSFKLEIDVHKIHKNYKDILYFSVYSSLISKFMQDNGLCCIAANEELEKLGFIYNDCGYFSSNTDILFQSIGKRDKNNVLIFDGDIVRLVTSSSYEWLPRQESERLTGEQGYYGVIRYCSFSCSYFICGLHDGAFNNLNIENKNIEVIGHKLTHPELLEKLRS